MSKKNIMTLRHNYGIKSWCTKGKIKTFYVNYDKKKSITTYFLDLKKKWQKVKIMTDTFLPFSLTFFKMKLYVKNSTFCHYYDSPKHFFFLGNGLPSLESSSHSRSIIHCEYQSQKHEIWHETLLTPQAVYEGFLICRI